MLDLFSGIGGFALAASWVWGEDLEIAAFCEIEEYPRKVLQKNFPNVPIEKDIKEMNGYDYRPIDLLTGGFPCQPFSQAGRRRGTEDDRDLWPEMFRIIQESQPRWVIGENVAGFTKMALDRTLSNLEDEGYTTEPFIIPAISVEARHRRDRVWIVAYDKSQWNGRWPRSRGNAIQRKDKNRRNHGTRGGTDVGQGKPPKNLADSAQQGSQRYRRLRERPGEWTAWQGHQPLKGVWEFEPDVDRVAYGISSRVDRIKGLGNAIVPQVAYEIMLAIREIEEGGYDE